MMNKIHILSLILLLIGVAANTHAQSPEPKSAIKIVGNIFGGGDLAKVEGSTKVIINQGQFAGEIFGGGNGALYDGADGVHAAGTVKASADISGDTHVTINGGEIVYTDGDEKNLRNIYGGGNLACNVAGNTNIQMTKGMITTYSFVSDPRAMAAWRYFYDTSMKPNQQKTPICSVFGAGYGAHTDVAGNTNININIPGTADIKPADGIAFTYTELEDIDKLALRLKPDTKLSEQFVPSVFGGGFDGTVGAYDATANAGAGGINYDKTTYDSKANITIQGQPFIFNVYGGGLGSKSGANATGGVDSHVGAVYGATKVDIQGGLYNGNVFGGGAGIESELDVPNPFGGAGTIKMPYTYAAQVMRETDVTISGNTTVIFGNVYGGGDIANTGWYNDGARPTMDGHQKQKNRADAYFDYATSLNLNGGNVLGSVFGGGNGRTKAQMQMSMFVGTVCGSTNVSVNGTKVWSHVYGGGNMGMVFDCHTIAASKSAIARAMVDNVLDGCTNVFIQDGMVAKDIFGGGFGDDPGTGEENVTSADVYGNTFVDFKKAELEFSKYWKPRTFLPSDATDEQMQAEETGKFLYQMSGGTYDNTESDVCHNLYGGGNVACTVKGNTYVYMTSAPTTPAGFSNTDYYKAAISNVAKPHFSVFGGGYGVLAKVTGNAHSDINLQQGAGLHSIIGGGMNGPIEGGTVVHVGNNPQSLVHYVYGGGYYAPCQKTNVQITGGTFLEDVFGGSVMGDINTGGALTDIATNLTIGLKSEGDGSTIAIKNAQDETLRTYSYSDLQNKITIMGNVYGGNDVSGIVNGIAKVTLNGGTVNGDVYGAGNGDHLGYYEPGIGHYTDGKNNNYYVVDHSGETSTDGKSTVGPKGDTYKGRPQTTGGVDLTLAGNTTEERVKVFGQVFGGGNSCTIGRWDAALLHDSKYHDDPHLVRDDPAYFLGGGQLHVTLGSHVTIGRTHAQLADAADGNKYLNNESENVSGLYMGCSGRHLATQNTDKEDHFYHHYYDRKTAKYWPGFAVFDNDGNPLSRQEGLASFNAYLNNILVWTDDVQLTIANDAEDIWLANFVGGGFRGSMKAMTAEGQFHYTLPRGVTVGHGIVGGAYNTDVVYRVYDTEDDMHTYKEADGHYVYRTTLKPEWTEGEDYHHIEYAADGTTPTGIIRFYYDGGMLKSNADDDTDRIGKVFKDYSTANGTPDNDNVIDFSGFDKDKGLRSHKTHALVYLEARCQLEPEVIDGKVNGGNVFGGCFESGTVDGDVWTDYRGYIAPKWYGNENFNGGDKMFSNAADYQHNFAMMAFGAGYGKNTNIKGDAYLRIIYNKENDKATYPCLYNVFGGSFHGTVDGNTNIYYNAGQQGLTVGAIYGGGSQGYVAGKSFVELAGGYIANVYGGAREANVGKGTHVWAYDSALRNWADDLPEGQTPDNAPLVIERMFGGSDVSGLIGFKADATDVSDGSKRVAEAGWTAHFSTSNWPEELFNNGTNADAGLKKFDSYIQIGGTDHSERGYPLVGQIYAGGNGEKTDTEHGQIIPGIDYALIELNDGNVMEAFGGGNAATVHKQNYILTCAQYDPVRNITLPNLLLTQILQKRVLKNVPDCYTLSGNTFTFDPYNVQRLFGGNNVATMAIQPKWNLKSGKIGKVYSGGNMGDMTYYNATPASGESKGLSITINSDDIEIGSLYGGCRMSDVKAMNGASPVTLEDDEYGATVNVLAGHIGNVYGGNDVSGYVYNGTNVNLQGSITGNVYGAGNGDYVYAYDNTEGNQHTGDRDIKEEMNADINKSVYWVKGNKDATVLQRLLALNNARPHVAKAYLNIEGKTAHDEVPAEKVYISGSVYCGGNASTIRPMTDDDDDAHVKFNIGDNVIVNEVFMGSNGASLKSEAYLQDFETVNPGFSAALQQDINWSEITESNVSQADKELVNMDEDLRNNLYPNLLSVYMRAVDMKAMPIGFSEFSGHDFKKTTWIGTFCMGGNAGSMLTDQPVDIIFPQSLNFFGRIIGGSKDASFQYKGKWHRGGFRMPLASTAKLDGKATKTKLRMRIRGDWYSRRMVLDDEYEDYRETYKDNDYLAPDKTNDGVTWDPAGKAWHDGCNVYGGCYQSGDMVGDVEIAIESDMLAYSRYLHDTKDAKIDDYLEPSLDESNNLKLPVANVYGAGYGPESRSFGDAYIYMKDIPNAEGWIHPSVNNIFGGGRNGMLVGNSVIHVHDGLVYKDVVGGSFGAPMYGSAQVTVGYPKFYICKQTGEYFLDRADKWNEDHKTKGYKDEPEDVIKKSIKYFKGTYVPCNVYEQITGVKVSTNDVLGELTSIGDYLKSNKENDNDYFEFHNEYDDSKDNPENFFPTGGWENVEILIRGGVYGGGFSLSNSTATIAGSYTTLASTEEYNHGVDNNGNSSIGYGGNSSIIITDQGTTKDHIKISTETTEKDAGGNVIGEYTGIGGIYGDGRLVFCEGFRAAELNGYGYAESTPSNPLMLNSLQRLDLLTVNDCCFKLYGDEDFATDEINKWKYSLARIGELRMNSTIGATGTYATGELTSAKSRNYIGFYNTIHYLGAIATNDDFREGKFHDATGAVDNENTYRSKKQRYIEQYHGKTDETSVNAFKERNYATARNMVGINSGYSLHVENQYYDNGTAKTYYGPIVGVAEVKLLNVQPGEGGGYVYADNVHADIHESGHSTSDATFMNESGNFVFEGVVRPGESETQYIVDDCLPTGFDDWKKGRAIASELPEQHYWYVIGDTYYYNTALTAFSYKGKKEFDLTNVDRNVIFAGIEDGWEVSLQSVKWLEEETPDASGNYNRDVRGGRDGDLVALDSNYPDTKYQFMLQVGDATTDSNRWQDVMPRATTTDEQITLQTWTPYNNSNTNPRFNVHILDNVNNCPEGEEETYFNDHLSIPEKVQLIIKARRQDGTTAGGAPTYEYKTYNVTLEIIYIQGPSFTGNVNIMNCALPGEHIGFNSKDIYIKTTDQLPVTGFDWKLVPVSETTNGVTGKTEYSWNEANGKIISGDYYSSTAEGYSQGSVPALYSQNHWNVYYVFHAGGEEFTVTPTTGEEAPLNERMLVVHNYHKMADIKAANYDVALSNTDGNIYAKALKPGAMIYLADADDIAAFVSYVNDGNATEGMHFYLQNDLTLPATITGTFAGTLHGDGYSLTLPTADGSLFGNSFDKDNAKVYNLGVPNGSITTVADASAAVINCFDSNDSNDNLLYGKKAYDLSHYYTTDHDHGNYVHTYYANNDGMGGDWRYARTTAAGTRYLRTAASPNYGLAQTSHNTEHADAYTITEHDCLFFGQELNPDAEKKYPRHIADNEDNRVYRTAGYYQSTTAEKFHYNRRAWALQPTLTAIDFTAENATVPYDSPSGFYGKTDDRPTSLVSFNSNSNASNDPNNNASTTKVSQNLLVYHNEDVNIIANEKPNTTEAQVSYHAVRKAGETVSTPQFHLVDKQDFCAPIAFNVTNRAWYERKPAKYAEKGNDAWEGICLPFTVSKATASLNGEISHFYGTPSEAELADPATNFHNLHHEYWLRGLVSISSADGNTTATFQRPGSDSPLFTQGKATMNYEYKNTWFKDTYDEMNYNGEPTQNNWYYTDATHSYADYKPLEANIPYIVSFPGSRYYEFDLSSKFYKAKMNETWSEADQQTITFSSAATTIPVTPAIQTTANGYTHTGTFLHVANAAYGMNDDGTGFESNKNAALPFRTYMTTSTSPAKARIIRISSDHEDDLFALEGQEEDAEPGDGNIDTDRMIRVYPEGGSIVIEANFEGRTTIYDAAGRLVRAVRFMDGINRYSGFANGLYIVAGTKILIRK